MGPRLFLGELSIFCRLRLLCTGKFPKSTPRRVWFKRANQLLEERSPCLFAQADRRACCLFSINLHAQHTPRKGGPDWNPWMSNHLWMLTVLYGLNIYQDSLGHSDLVLSKSKFVLVWRGRMWCHSEKTGLGTTCELLVLQSKWTLDPRLTVKLRKQTPNMS